MRWLCVAAGNRRKQEMAKLRHREPQRGVAIHAARPRLYPMAIVVRHHGLPRRCAPRNDGMKALSGMAREGVGDRVFCCDCSASPQSNRRKHEMAKLRHRVHGRSLDVQAIFTLFPARSERLQPYIRALMRCVLHRSLMGFAGWLPSELKHSKCVAMNGFCQPQV